MRHGCAMATVPQRFVFLIFFCKFELRSIGGQPIDIANIRYPRKKLLYALKFYIMAKNIGPIKFTGKLGGLSGRNTAFGNVIQTPGGFKSERLKNDPIYLKSRQCSAEFAHCSKTAALFRQQLLPYLRLLPDPYVYNHIQKRVLAIKDCDPTSPKGSKTFDKGMSTEAGAALLRNFSFNRKRQFYFAGISGHSIDIKEGRLTLNDVNPNMFDYPGTANAVGFQLILFGVDLSLPALTTSECFI